MKRTPGKPSKFILFFNSAQNCLFNARPAPLLRSISVVGMVVVLAMPLMQGRARAELATTKAADQNPAQAQAPPASLTQPAATQPTVTQPTVAAAPETASAYALPPEKLAKAIALGRIRNLMYFISTVWGFAVLWILLASGWAAGLAGWTERTVRRWWIQGLLFFAMLLLITSVADLPISAIGNAVSRHFGISVQGWPSWLGDQGKGLGLTVLFGAPILLLFNAIVRRWPRRYWLGIWLVTLPLIVLTIFGEPLLAPLFNKFEPLTQHNPALVLELEKVVARTRTAIPPQRMFLMKASEKTNGLNAYVSGIGATKRIVVWDTTAGRIPNDEVLFIFGHESGHYVLHHIPKMLFGTAFGSFFVFWIGAGLAGWLLARWGARWHTESLASRQGMVVLLLSLSMISFLGTPISNAFSRYFEHEADVYGQEAIQGIVADPQKATVASFNDLGQAWLEDPHPNPVIEFWLFGHPSVSRRADFARRYNPWAKGGRGQFFDR